MRASARRAARKRREDPPGDAQGPQVRAGPLGQEGAVGAGKVCPGGFPLEGRGLARETPPGQDGGGGFAGARAPGAQAQCRRVPPPPPLLPL